MHVLFPQVGWDFWMDCTKAQPWLKLPRKKAFFSKAGLSGGGVDSFFIKCTLLFICKANDSLFLHWWAACKRKEHKRWPYSFPTPEYHESTQKELVTPDHLKEALRFHHHYHFLPCQTLLHSGFHEGQERSPCSDQGLRPGMGDSRFLGHFNLP